MFKPLDAGKTTPPGRVQPLWRAIMPVPDDAASAFPNHHLGKPSSCWVYRDLTGRRLFIAARFDLMAGGKVVLPLTYAEAPDGRREWKWQAPPAPRPLYGIDRLAQRPAAPVLVTEGEKAADAADTSFQDYVAITSQGGAAAVGKSDWRPLRGRNIVIWPDCDDAGQSYARDVVRHAMDAGAASVRLVEVPEVFPAGWDLADELPAGWDLQQLRALLEAAQAVEPECAKPIPQTPDWPQPDLSLVREDRPSAPRFDWDAVPPAWRDWLRDTAQDCGAPPDYVFAGLLATASAALGNARRVSPWGGWIEQPHLWFALVGNPSAGKTPALRPFGDATHQIERAGDVTHQTDMATWLRDDAAASARRESWQADVKAAVKAGGMPPDCPADAISPRKPSLPRLVMCNASTEALHEVLAANPKGVLLDRDELAGLVGQFDKYGGSGDDRAFYLECWNGGHFVVDRKKLNGVPLSIPYASLAIIGGITPDRLSAVWKGPDDGLAARFLYVWPEPVPPCRPTTSGFEQRARALVSALSRLRGLALGIDANGGAEPRSIGLAEPALLVLDRVRDEVAEANKEDTGFMAGWRGKGPGRLLRLGLVLEYLRWAVDGGPEPDLVSEGAIRQAADYLEYATQMVERTLGGMGLDDATRDAARAARWIVKHGSRTLNGRALSKEAGQSRLRDAEVRRRAFDVLSNAGFIRQSGVKSGAGRKADLWDVNPALWLNR